MKHLISKTEEESGKTDANKVFVLGCQSFLGSREENVFVLPIIQNAGESYYVISTELKTVKQYMRAIMQSMDTNAMDLQIRSLPVEQIRECCDRISASDNCSLMDIREYLMLLRHPQEEMEHTSAFHYWDANNDVKTVVRESENGNEGNAYELRPVIYGDNSKFPDFLNNQVARALRVNLEKNSNLDGDIFLPYLRHTADPNDYSNFLLGSLEEYANADIAPAYTAAHGMEEKVALSPNALALILRILGKDNTQYLDVSKEQLEDLSADDSNATFTKVVETLTSQLPGQTLARLVFPAINASRTFTLVSADGKELTSEEVNFEEIIPAVLVLPSL